MDITQRIEKLDLTTYYVTLEWRIDFTHLRAG